VKKGGFRLEDQPWMPGKKGKKERVPRTDMFSRISLGENHHPSENALFNVMEKKTGLEKGTREFLIPGRGRFDVNLHGDILNYPEKEKSTTTNEGDRERLKQFRR